MKLPVPYIQAWFKEKLWHLAIRHETGIWAADDIVNEVLIRLSEEDFPDRRTWSRYHRAWCRTNPAYVIRQAWRECQKIRRHETRRLCADRPSNLIEDARVSNPVVSAAVAEVLAGLTDRQRTVLELKATLRVPSMTNISRRTGLSRATVCRTLIEVRSLLETAVS